MKERVLSTSKTFSPNVQKPAASLENAKRPRASIESNDAGYKREPSVRTLRSKKTKNRQSGRDFPWT